jgi:hypothetical protein
LTLGGHGGSSHYRMRTPIGAKQDNIFHLNF